MTDIVERLRDISPGPSELLDALGNEAADEIERLRAGGCARDQTTTQFCAEAVRLLAVMERMREWENHMLRDRAALRSENERLREALSSIVEAWDWWQVDPYDRCQSVPSDAINEARAALAEKEEK